VTDCVRDSTPDDPKDKNVPGTHKTRETYYEPPCPSTTRNGKPIGMLGKSSMFNLFMSCTLMDARSDHRRCTPGHTAQYQQEDLVKMHMGQRNVEVS